jgi:anti-sigma factor RsiW
MDCQNFLARFSDFTDGRAEEAVSREMEAHRSCCERCRRYSDTIEAGMELLRGLPALEVPPDFRPRLNHRIFHLEDGVSLARPSLGSGATMASVLAVAGLVALSAWAPAVGDFEPVMDLPAVVVADPPDAAFTPTQPNPTFPRSRSFFTTTEFQDGIWGNSHDLLREYSPVLDRRRNQALVRVGIE